MGGNLRQRRRGGRVRRPTAIGLIAREDVKNLLGHSWITLSSPTPTGTSCSPRERVPL